MYRLIKQFCYENANNSPKTWESLGERCKVFETLHKNTSAVSYICNFMICSVFQIITPGIEKDYFLKQQFLSLQLKENIQIQG